MDNIITVRCISIYDKIGYETPNAMAVLHSHIAVDRVKSGLKTKIAELLRLREQVLKGSEPDMGYVARIDEKIALMCNTLKIPVPQKIR